jgi:hypothetical protein
MVMSQNKINEQALRQAINKWEETVPISIALNPKALRKHMLNEHGINLPVFPSTNISVVDEKKYLLFLLKFS